MKLVATVCSFIILIVSQIKSTECAVDRTKLNELRERVRDMFHASYDSYMRYAFPFDELRPLTCDGVDTWAGNSLSLIDALDTLAILGNHSEFRKAARIVIDKTDFNKDLNVSVFETNIRVVGGLLSAHLLQKKVGMELEEGWPCQGPLLRLAVQVADKLLPAFDTSTGMPYGTVNLKYGVPIGETSITCTAGVGTFIVEFASLSRLTGNPIYEETAIRALKSLWTTKSKIGLLGNHIDVQSSKWTASDASIGAGVDSYFEYLIKGAMITRKPWMLEQFEVYRAAINKYMRKDDWFVLVRMQSGEPTLPYYQSLESFWPGLLTLAGHIEDARKSFYNYHQVWKQLGFIPEFYDITRGTAHDKREGYPLRPEFIESCMYLYQATKDTHFLEVGEDVLTSLEHSAKTDCGYSSVRNVADHRLENRMESFFLAETTKYLYLLFDPDNFIHNPFETADSREFRLNNADSTLRMKGLTNGTVKSHACLFDSGGYVFNTEAHVIDIALLDCCSASNLVYDEQIQIAKDMPKAENRREELVELFKDVSDVPRNMALNVSEFLTHCYDVEVVPECEDEPETVIEASDQAKEEEAEEDEDGEGEATEDKVEAESDHETSEKTIDGLSTQETADKTKLNSSTSRVCESKDSYSNENIPTRELSCLAQPITSQFALRGHITDES